MQSRFFGAITGLGLLAAISASTLSVAAQSYDDGTAVHDGMGQQNGMGPHDGMGMNQPGGMMPEYDSWQTGWNHNHYDRHHVILGRVESFKPYRLEIRRRNGDVQRVDLKNGTRIIPEGTTPMHGEHIAAIGYYSNGTFIVNRLIVR